MSRACGKPRGRPPLAESQRRAPRPPNGTLGAVGRETAVFQFDGVGGQQLIYDGLDTDFDNVTARLAPSGRNARRLLNT